MNQNQAADLLETYFSLMTMNGAARVYRASRELGIISAVGAGHRTAEAVARACGLEERPLEYTLEVLQTLGVLEHGDDGYSLAPMTLMLRMGYEQLGDEYWDHLPTFLRTGEPVARMDALEESEEAYQAQVFALAWMMGPSAERAASLLEIGTRRKHLRILDLGAGAAVWSLAFASRDAGSTVTAVDWPRVLEIASASAARRGAAERFTALPGNFHEVDLEAGAYDLVILGNVTHIETAEGNRSLFHRAHRALAACRLVHDAADGLPGVTVDVYGAHAVVNAYRDPHDVGSSLAWRVAERLHELGFLGVYLKQRPRTASRIGEDERLRLAPPHASFGASAPAELVVAEAGLRYSVRLNEGMSTGLFTDQRDNRARVRKSARGQDVLNLFSYTCSFGVVAAVAGARSVTNVDVSAPALAQGRVNCELNAALDVSVFHRDDVFDWLSRARRRDLAFDLAIVDPPTFSTTKKTRWKSGAGFVDLVQAVLHVTRPGGRILVCSNDQRLSLAKLRRHIHAALKHAGRRAEQLRDYPQPPDYPLAVNTPAHLKSVWVKLADSH